MEIMMKMFPKVFFILLAVWLLHSPSVLQAQGTAPSMFDKKEGGLGKFKRLSFGASNSKCGEYVKRKKWKKD